MRHILHLIFLMLSPEIIFATTDSLRNNKIKEVEITASSPVVFSGQKEGRIYWKMESLENLPHLLGSADPLRFLQLLPGISTNNDYSSGIHIQGCASSHSLLELDGAPVFNSSHLLGLFSIFTPSHFRGMTLVKNRHSSSFDNRLGGYLNFSPIDSISKDVHVNATVSFMESEGTLTLPVGKKSTLYISGRGSYLNLLYGDLLEMEDMKLKYGLQDYNATYVIRPSESDKIQLSFYHGRDKLDLWQEEFQSDGNLEWNNTVASLNWQRYTGKLMSKQTAYFSKYHNTLDMGLSSIKLDLGSGITQSGYKSNLTWTKGVINWDAGLAYAYYHMTPLKFNAEGSYLNNQTPDYQEDAHELSAYAHARLPFLKKWSVDAGIRTSLFHSHRKTFAGIDPRLTFTYRINRLHQLSLHYGIYHQYLHQVSLSNGGFPVDYWIASSRDIHPEKAHSTVMGYHFESPSKTYEFTAEIYYKWLSQQTEYYGSVFDLFTTSYDMKSTLMHGKGRNYGIDFMFKCNKGPVTGWISYTLSRSKRQFLDLSPHEWFNSIFDRRHDLSLVANYKINAHWSLGGDFVYASGTPYTQAKNIYILNNNLINEYGKHNGAHLPATHRMDVSATYHFTPRKHVEQSLNISIFNLYAHRNVLFRYMGYKKDYYGYKSVYSLCRLLPSLGYSLKF